jgi:hypothetical protein
MIEFDGVWKAAVRFRRVGRELEGLVRGVYVAIDARDFAATRSALEQLLVFLCSETGRTDANCATTDYFFALTEQEWTPLVPEALRAILDDMSGTLHDTIYAPKIASTFESTPEQLLERVRLRVVE